jgi:hypothetical protein
MFCRMPEPEPAVSSAVPAVHPATVIKTATTPTEGDLAAAVQLRLDLANQQQLVAELTGQKMTWEAELEQQRTRAAHLEASLSKIQQETDCKVRPSLLHPFGALCLEFLFSPYGRPPPPPPPPPQQIYRDCVYFFPVST